MKLIEKYPEPELYTAISRLLLVSRALEKNKSYDIRYLSARAGTSRELCRDVLDFLVIGGFYERKRDFEYYVKDGEI